MEWRICSLRGQRLLHSPWQGWSNPPPHHHLRSSMCSLPIEPGTTLTLPSQVTMAILGHTHKVKMKSIGGGRHNYITALLSVFQCCPGLLIFIFSSLAGTFQGIIVQSFSMVMTLSRLVLDNIALWTQMPCFKGCSPVERIKLKCPWRTSSWGTKCPWLWQSTWNGDHNWYLSILLVNMLYTIRATQWATKAHNSWL